MFNMVQRDFEIASLASDGILMAFSSSPKSTSFNGECAWSLKNLKADRHLNLKS